MTNIFNKTDVKEKRRALRKRMPPAEVTLWSKLRSKGLNGCKFRRQYSIGSYIVDFYCPQIKLVIEVDGDSHFVDGADSYDRNRQAIIESLGISFLRFTNRDVYERLEGVINTILERISKSDLPSPLLGTEGN